jgi:hypothetical protein
VSQAMMLFSYLIRLCALVPILFASFAMGARADDKTRYTMHLVVVDLASRPDIGEVVSYVVSRPRQVHAASPDAILIRVIGMVGERVIYDDILADFSPGSERKLREDLQRNAKLVDTDTPLSVNALTARIRENVNMIEPQLNITNDPTQVRPTLVVHLVAKEFTFRTRVKGKSVIIRLNERTPPDACYRALEPHLLVGPPQTGRNPLVVLDFISPENEDIAEHSMRSVLYAMFGSMLDKMTVVAYRDRLTCVGPSDALSIRPLTDGGECAFWPMASEERTSMSCVPSGSPEGASVMTRRRNALAVGQNFAAAPPAEVPRTPQTSPSPPNSQQGSAPAGAPAPVPSIQPPQASVTPQGSPSLPDSKQGTLASNTATPSAPSQAPITPQDSPSLPHSKQGASPSAPQAPSVRPPPLPVTPQASTTPPSPRPKEARPDDALALPPSRSETPQRVSPPVETSPKLVQGPPAPSIAPTKPDVTPSRSHPPSGQTVALATRRRGQNVLKSPSTLALTRQPAVTRGTMPAGIKPEIVLRPPNPENNSMPWPIPVGIDQGQPPSWAAQSVIAVRIPEGALCDETGMIGFTFELQGVLVPDEYAIYDVVVAGACEGRTHNVSIASFATRK